MAFDPSRLYTQLQITALANKDQPLYQLIYQMISALVGIAAQIAELVAGTTSGGGGGGTTTTTNVYQQLLMNSPTYQARHTLMMGVPTGLISGGSSTFVEWSVLTNGDPVNPELIFGSGDVIMTHIP